MAVSPATSDPEPTGLDRRDPSNAWSAATCAADFVAANVEPEAKLISSAPRGLERALLAFVVLGVLVRVGHYIVNYPLWGDEAFLALSFVRRGYRELLLPLEFGQICPILFLWAELTAVKLFGFSEMSLRLCPLICGIASVFLFRRVAGRILSGQALLLAVGIFAVSIHPIRHSADAKPYASDLLVALVLLALAVEWYRSSQRSCWLWLLAAFAPIALAASYPAMFVAGGIGLALAPSVWMMRRWGPRVGLAAYGLTTMTTFAAVFLTSAHEQRGTGTMRALQNYWADSFPPLNSPTHLFGWLIRIHSGSMLAYPGGGNHGASALTLILVLIGAVVLWKRGQKRVLALLVMPAVLGLLAAGMKMYPYGGQARIMQYIAPAICLMAGAGLAGVLGAFPRANMRLAAIKVTAVALAIMGIVLVVEDFRHPYRAVYDYQVREFARRFWPEQARAAELASLEWDFGVQRPKAAGVRTALFLCNQHIYSPNRRQSNRYSEARVTSDRPLRCVVFDEEVLARPEGSAWLESMKKGFVLHSRSQVVVPSTGLNQQPWADHLTVLEFLPKADRPTPVVAGAAIDNRVAR